MVVYVPSGQTTQLVGMPPLPQSSYDRIQDSVRDVYSLYREMAREVSSESSAVSSK